MDKVESYFEEKSKFWIDDAYVQHGFNYPVGAKRKDVLNKIFEKIEHNSLNILDIGCGGGDISFELAQKGHNVIGVDRSTAMIDICNQRLESCSENIRRNLKFIQSDFENIENVIEPNSIDMVIAFGFIGYLVDDETFYRVIDKKTKTNAQLVLSWRNELFNFYPTSSYQVKAVEAETAVELMKQVQEICKEEIPTKNVKEFLINMKNVLNALDLENINFETSEVVKKDEGPSETTNEIEARQQNLCSMKSIANHSGWELVAQFGVHPHLLPPSMRQIFPPDIYNALSDSLLAFDEFEIAQLWSSVMVGVFNKSL